MFLAAQNSREKRKLFIKLAKKMHPDKGGTATNFITLKKEYETEIVEQQYHRQESIKTMRNVGSWFEYNCVCGGTLQGVVDQVAECDSCSLRVKFV